MTHDELRAEVLRITLLLCEKNLIRLSAGNISLHDGEGHVAITPAGMPYDQMAAASIPIVDLEGKLIDGAHKPSSETPMHTTILREIPNIRGVVHTHSIYAIAFAITGTELPPACLELLAVGAPIPVATYACPGSAEAGRIAIELLRARPGLKCVMLRNHGLISVGSNLYDAYQNAYKLETGAEAFHLAMQIGKPVSLDSDQIDEIYRTYRRPVPVAKAS